MLSLVNLIDIDRKDEFSEHRNVWPDGEQHRVQPAGRIPSMGRDKLGT
jgi:hypothetical protein